MKPQLYLINGPLGAGKTTVLKYLLSLPEFKNSRIIENEFANYSVDTEQLHEHESVIQTIAGVCICCSTGDELIDALKDLVTSEQPVIIEATGVANSLRLVEKLVLGNMFDVYSLAHGLFVLDAREAIESLDETLLRYRNELLAADTVLLSKADLISETDLEVVEIALKNMGVEYFSVSKDGAFDPELLKRKSGMLNFFADLDEEIRNHDADTSYTVIQLDGDRFSSQQLSDSWEVLQNRFGLRRMKGDFVDGDGVKWHVEATPHQIRCTKGSSAVQSLVCIGSAAHELTKSAFVEIVSER